MPRREEMAAGVTRRLDHLANRLGELTIAGSRAHYQLGEIIDEVFHERLWKHWPNNGPFENVGEWCWVTLGRRYSAANTLRKNFIALQALQLSEDTLARAMRVGSGKIRHIVKVARTETDLLRWVDLVEDERLREDQLVAAVRHAEARRERNRDHGRDEVDAGEEVAIRQAALDARAVRRQRDRTPTPDTSPREESLPDAAPTDGTDETRVTWQARFRQDDLRIFLDAVNIMRARFQRPDMGYSECIALMATSYLSALPRDDEGGLAVEVEYLIRGIEGTYGVHLEVVDDDTGASADDDEEEAYNF
jgi:hypothetical protein